MKSTARLVRDTHQKAFAKIFDGLVGRYSRWQVWQDFIVLSACSVSNMVDKSHAEKREKTYLSIAGKYSPEEMSAFSRMLAEIVLGIESNPDQDFLGELYMNLELGNSQAGQFFTPYDVCRMMARVTIEETVREKVEQHGWVAVNDCACGAGATLIAAANECLRQGVNYQTRVLFTAQDIDWIVGMMCYLQLSLIGAAGYVEITDSLIKPTLCVDRRGLIPRPGPNVWYTPMYFREEWHFRRVYARMDRLWARINEEVPEC